MKITVLVPVVPVINMTIETPIEILCMLGHKHKLQVLDILAIAICPPLTLVQDYNVSMLTLLLLMTCCYLIIQTSLSLTIISSTITILLGYYAVSYHLV